MAKRTSKAYSQTTVSISKSRESIDAILTKWGVSGIQWEDNFDVGYVQLRFRWKRNDKAELVARFKMDIDSDEKLRERAIDQRSGRFSEKKYQRELLSRGKREHRTLFHMLKSLFEAIDDGILSAEALFLPWIEDADGRTVYEKVAPHMDQLAYEPLQKALTSGSGE